MQPSEEFMDLMTSALAWEPPPGVLFAVLADRQTPTLDVLMTRQSDGMPLQVKILLATPPEHLGAGLDEAANLLLARQAHQCEECRSQALPSLDAAAAAFEASIEEIGGRKP